MKKIAIILIVLFASFETYAVEMGGWIRRADFGAQGRHRGTGCAAGNRGYFGLGHYNGTGVNIVLKDWWEYDPGTNAWTQKADFIGGSSNGNYAVLIFGIGDNAYITGGTFNDLNTYKYSTQTNTWTIVAQAPVNFSNIEGFVVGNKGYVVRINAVYEFDASTYQWTMKSQAPFNSSTWMGAFSMEDKGYVRTSSGFYEYKPSIDTWITRAPFPGIANAASMNFVQHGKAYVVAGYGGTLSNVTDQVWRYDPLQNNWELLEEFPGSSRRFGSSFSIGDRSFVGIGTNGTNFNDFWEYDADLYLNTDYLDIAQVTVYPNPAVEEVNIRLDAVNEFEATLIDMNGKIWKTVNTQSGNCKILRENLPAGTYMIKISVAGNLLGTKTLIFN